MSPRTDLQADCAWCVGLCCVALAFARSADFAYDKPAGEPCTHLADDDRCRVHADLRPLGFKGCTVFDCFGAGQHVTQRTFAGRSWREDTAVRSAMVTVFPIARRMHELLWYLEEARDLAAGTGDAGAIATQASRVRGLADLPAESLRDLDVDAEYAAARPLLLAASEHARAGIRPARQPDRRLGPGSDLSGSDLSGSDLSGTDLRGVSLRGSSLIAADLSGARLARCDLLGVDLRDADLTGADLREAIYLTRMQVHSAVGDATTRLPEGFDRPGHWPAPPARDA